MYVRDSIDMMQEKFVVRQLNRYIHTRRIQFVLQDIHVIFFFSNYNDIQKERHIYCVMSPFSFFDDFTEQLAGCLYK